MANFGDPRLPQRFWDRCVPVPFAGCWLWTGAAGRYGEANHSKSGLERYAHRVAYQALVGPIHPGRELDHLCRSPLCVNPAHLEAVTHAENVRRGQGGINHRSKTHCIHGHPFDEINTRMYGRRRVCRACERGERHP